MINEENEMNKAYTVFALDNDKVVIDDCGHKHRTYQAAEDCRLSKGNAARWYHAEVRSSDGSGIEE